ncbi:MAG TPA: single-stranded DNA-binding protein, partial [Bacilli bacterium]|nr:single-stranded DNA-binding protein [Bacilli bacterium]
EGRLNQRSYDRRDGTKASVLEVVCDSVQFLEPKGEPRSEETGFTPDEQPAEDSKNLDAINIVDDDLPF